jgi:hypothetical protein
MQSIGLSLHNFVVAAGYYGRDGLRDNQVALIQNGANTEVQIESHIGEHHWVTAVTLQNVLAPSRVHGRSNWLTIMHYFHVLVGEEATCLRLNKYRRE